MTRFFRHPATNAVGISLFSAFYSVIFLAFPDRVRCQTGQTTQPFWKAWDAFLEAGGHRYVALVLIAVTIVVLALIIAKHRPYDEYHTAILITGLAVSIIICLAAIAVLFVAVLADPTGIVSKLALFITINWSSVVFCDLVYLLICGRT